MDIYIVFSEALQREGKVIPNTEYIGIFVKWS